MLRELSVVEQRYRAVLEVAAGVPVTGSRRIIVATQKIHVGMIHAAKPLQ
jgi:hypothetical protein